MSRSPCLASRISQLSLLAAAAATWVACAGNVASSGLEADNDGGGSSAAGSSGGSSGAAGGSSSGSVPVTSGSSSGGAAGASSSGNGTAGGSSSGAPSGSSSGSSSGGPSGSSSGGPSPEAGAVWQPTTAAPIHFHWMIGASTFSTADILPGQQGQVVYDIDGENATAADVSAIHAAGAIAVCYVDVGTLEPGRSDVSKFPASVIGADVQGWPGEKWLLVTAANQPTILPLMQARFQTWCRAKGFDAIEPDNLDAWTNIKTVSETDNVAYDLAIGKVAHALPLSIGLKNVMTDLDSSQYASFLATFDWALNEQCYEYSECGAYTAAGSFIPAGKAVWDVEYNVAPTCSDANGSHLNAQETDLDLVGAKDSGYTYTPCIPDSQATW